ncbi:hypothetical protein Sango_0772300, partial [Sesamum angolense]
IMIRWRLSWRNYVVHWILLSHRDLRTQQNDMQIDVSCLAEGQSDFSNERAAKFKLHGAEIYAFKLFSAFSFEKELSHQIEKKKTTLKTLQDLDSYFRRFEAVEKIEDAFTGVKVIEIEGNNIRLSLKTYIPYLESVLRQQDIESVIEPLEMNHELIVETMDGTWELKNVEIFPNDVYIGEIIDAAKTFRFSRKCEKDHGYGCRLRQLNPTSRAMVTRSSLEWFVRRVQDRIALSSLRRFVVKNANKSRFVITSLFMLIST